jgi:murein L,D-transpeptidase YcbB/YkuD
MANYNISYNKTCIREGGYGKDNNGYDVVVGVNRQYFPKFAGWTLIDPLIKAGKSNKEISAFVKSSQQMQGLIKLFYYNNFWLPLYDKIASQDVADWLYDKGVNMGLGQATKLLQRAAGCADDGKFGPATLAAINSIDHETLINNAHANAKSFYLALHAKNPAKYPLSMAERA